MFYGNCPYWECPNRNELGYCKTTTCIIRSIKATLTIQRQPQHNGKTKPITQTTQRKEAARMATKEELFAAVRLIKEHCDSMAEEACRDCPLQSVCNRCFIGIPDEWPDPKEGGGEDG